MTFYRELTLAVQIVGEDFFFNEFRDEFLDTARYLISKAYCRIHQRIDIGCVSNILSVSLSDSSGIQPPPERLNLSRGEGEKRIVNLVNLIRETRMGADAKIDLEKVTKIRVLLLSSFSIGCRTSSRSTDHLYLSTNP